MNKESQKSTVELFRNTIRDVPDFPKPGILFKDITPVLAKPTLCKEIADILISQLQNIQIDAVAAIESRGFLFGMLLAQKLNVPFVPVRKKGKLPYKTLSQAYSLEYGSAEVEIHIDSIKENSNVLIHDDLLATGGTAAATAELIKQSKAKVAAFSFLISLDFLEGKSALKKHANDIFSVLNY